MYRGTDKFLARPGRKQTRKHVRDARDFNNFERRAVINFFFLQVKATKEIHIIMTETLACFLPDQAKNLSAPLYKIKERVIKWAILMQEFDNVRFNFHIKWLLCESNEKENKIYRQRSISIRKTKCNGKYSIGVLMDEIKFLTLQRVSTINW